MQSYLLVLVLIVLGTVHGDYLKVTTSTTDVQYGSQTTLTCTVTSIETSVSSVTITWTNAADSSVGSHTKTDSLLANGSKTSRLTLPSSKTQPTSLPSTLTYTCTVVLSGVTYTSKIAPSIFKITQPTSTLSEFGAGKAATLTCTLSSGSTAPSAVKWVIDAAKNTVNSGSDSSYYTVTDGSFVSGTQTSTLVIDGSKVTADEATLYSCKFQVEDDWWTIAAALKVIAVTVGSTEVAVGNPATLTCQTDKAATFKWMVEGDSDVLTKTSTASNAKYTVTDTDSKNNKLVVAGSAVTKDFMATCIVVESVMSREFNYAKTVPTYEIIAEAKEVMKGSAYSVTCIADGITSTGYVMKYTSGSTTVLKTTNAGGIKGTQAGNTLTVTFTNVNLLTSTTGDCVVDTFKVSHNIQIFDITTSTKEVMVGSEATITCTLVDGVDYADRKFKWKLSSNVYTVEDNASQGNVIVSVASDKLSSKLVESVTTGDKSYTCLVEVDDVWFEKVAPLKTFSLGISNTITDLPGSTEAKFTCAVSGIAASSHYFVWFVNGAQQSISIITTSGTGSVLTVASGVVVKDLKVGCAAIVEGSFYSTSKQFYVYSIKSVSSMEVMKGSTAALTCIAKIGKTANFDIKWYEVGVSTAKSGAVTSTDTASLTKTSVYKSASVSADMNFKCVVENGDSNYPNVEQSTTVKMFDVSGFRTSAALQGSTPTIKCTVTDSTTAFPDANVRWVNTDSWQAYTSGDSVMHNLESSALYLQSDVTSGSFVISTTNNDYVSKITIVVNTGTIALEGCMSAALQFTQYPSTQRKSWIITKTSANKLQVEVNGVQVLDYQLANSATFDNCVERYGDVTQFAISTSISLKYLSSTASYVVTNGQNSFTTSYTPSTKVQTLAKSGIASDLNVECQVRVAAGEEWFVHLMAIDAFRIVPVDDINEAGGATMPHCHVYDMQSGVQAKTTMAWKNEAQQTISDSSRLSTSSGGVTADRVTLTIPSSRTSDLTYTCTTTVAMSDGFTKAFEETLTINVASFVGENALVKKGDGAILECTIGNINNKYDSWKWESPGTVPSNTMVHTLINEDADGKKYTIQNTLGPLVVAEHEGFYTCSFVFVRDEAMSLSRTVSRIIVLGVPEMLTNPINEYKQVDASVDFTCKGRDAKYYPSGVTAPTYVWKVNGNTGVGTDALDGSTKVSKLTVTAAANLDNAAVSCTVTWTQLATTTSPQKVVSITESSILYAKNVVVTPATNVYAAIGVQVEMTCVYTSHHPSATTKWYLGAGTTTLLSNDASYKMTATRDTTAATDTMILSIVSPQSSYKGNNYRCVLAFDAGGEWSATLTLKEIYDTTSLTFAPTQPISGHTTKLISGYTATLTATVTAGSSDEILYVWSKGSTQVASHKTDTKTDTYTLPQTFFADKDVKYEVAVTWTSFGQVITQKNSRTIDMLDSCGVIYTNVNADGDITTVNNVNPYILDTTAVATTCKKGYLLPDATAYSQSCSVDNQMTFKTCQLGCWYGDAPANSIYVTSDTYKLTGSGYTTIHQADTVTINCATDYTLRKAWNKIYTCGSSTLAAAELVYDGNCVAGCKLVRNAYTKTPYTVHGSTLLAKDDSLNYKCEENTATDTGFNNADVTCSTSTAGSDLALDKCSPVLFGAPTVVARSATILVTVSNPTYPTTGPSMITAHILDYAKLNVLESKKMNSDNQVVFEKLTPESYYQLMFTINYANGAVFTSGRSIHNTEDLTKLLIETDNGTVVEQPVNSVRLEIPETDFVHEGYKVLSVYRSDDYIGDISNWVFKFVDEAHTDKRAAPTVVIYIYPSYEAMHEANVDLGAWIAESVTSLDVKDSDAYTVEYGDYDLVPNAEYYMMMMACENGTTKFDDCYTGSYGLVNLGDSNKNIVIIGLLAALFIVVFLLIFCACLVKHKVYKQNQDDPSKLYQNPVRGY